MPTLFGKKYTKSELLSLVGDISQIGGATRVMLVDGPHAGVEAVEFRTGAGFSFRAVPGRGMDITCAEHNGRSLAWRTAVGERNAAFYEEQGAGWLRSFPGGLLTTCGLTNTGAPCVDDGESLGVHGRISNIPASNVCVDGEWDGDEYRMWASGKVRETRLFGENLLVRRKVSAVLGQNKLWIEDSVTNEGPRTTPHMILYHINAGYPVLNAGSEFIAPTKNLIPRDPDAEVGVEHYRVNNAPTAGFKEQVFYHDMATDADGFAVSALVNKNMPDGGVFGFYVKFKKSELPRFMQWKMNGMGEYVVGMEPANCWVEGREKERERGTLQFLEPGETRKYNLEIGVLTSAQEVAELEQLVKSMVL